ncbi:TPA: O-antigen translocase [Vibrio vulnificus]|nr:O-antigen translocase [Vibrio vulnificus]ELC9717434.1 O-antigen translocase [Vibrio vulnificus]ELS0762140.1 O-antigen translocase [Vibrio vulnificus]ELV8618674.1 O-antigen translocase [Vibrio vulnificus]
MNLAKTSFLSLVVTLFKMLSGLAINKAVAVFIGPSGLAMIGQFKSFMQICMVLGQGGINAGITKYCAENNGNRAKINSLVSTSFAIGFVLSIMIAIVFNLMPKDISVYIFDSAEYSYIIRLLGMVLIFYVFNTYFLSVLNGLGNTDYWFKINIIQSITSIGLTLVLIFFYELQGVLLALILNQSVVFACLILLLKNNDILKSIIRIDLVNRTQARKLLKFGLMALISAVVVPVSHIVIRDYITNRLDSESVGYWQGMWYISSMYLMVLTSTLSVYYLPKFSSLRSKYFIWLEMKKGMIIFVLIASILALLIYCLREYIIFILFSEKFYNMAVLFKWQLSGDVIKIASWFFGYLMLAKAKMKSFIFCEIFFSILFVVLSIVFIDYFGLRGISYAYFTNYLIYFFVSFLLVFDELSFRPV